MMTNNHAIKNIKKTCVLLLCAMQISVILISWILAAAYPEYPVHSLLSSEGIRWFFGNITQNMQTPVLVWLLVGSVAYGAVKDSKILYALLECFSKNKLPYRQRLALSFVFIEFIVCIVVMFLLAGMPHAILLSVTGDLFPSSFSRSLIPMISFCLSMFSVTFSTISGIHKTLDEVIDMLTSGIAYTLPLWPIYILGVQLYFSILFCFSQVI